MTTDLPDPLGFPQCPRCYYRDHGSPATCMACAHQTLTHPTGPTCGVCAQELDANGSCGNEQLCESPTRSIDRIEAIAVYSGDLRSAIVRLKDSDRYWGWSVIFGRLVLGHLNFHRLVSSHYYDVIVANPGFKPDGRLGHTELVVRAAATEDIYCHWNFHPTGLRLSKAKTPRGHSLAEKRAAANELQQLIVIDNDLSLTGAHVLVYDDVCTSGMQLDAVARRLKSDGAASVVGLVLARAPWT